MHSFEDLELAEELVEALASEGFDEPTEYSRWKKCYGAIRTTDWIGRTLGDKIF